MWEQLGRRNEHTIYLTGGMVLASQGQASDRRSSSVWAAEMGRTSLQLRLLVRV